MSNNIIMIAIMPVRNTVSASISVTGRMPNTVSSRAAGQQSEMFADGRETAEQPIEQDRENHRRDYH